MRRLVIWALVLVAGPAAGTIEGCDPSGPPAALPKDAIPLIVGVAPSEARIPSGFVGISTEFSALPAYAGSDPEAINPTFIQLLRNLSPGGPPVLRIGGDTTDWTWLPVGGATKPPWARFVLTPAWIAVARAVAHAAQGKLILGINFEADSRQLARREASALLKGVGRRSILAFELGNEPEIYGEIGWYGNVLGRPAGYDFRAYLPDFKRVSSALPESVPLAGPALALTWPLTIARRFLSANPRVRLFTFHFYPLKRCYNPRSSPTYPTLAHLMAPQAARQPAGVRDAVIAAHATGVSVRVDEFNSVSCRGLNGLSDTFASALWVLDALFHLARAGVAGVNVHTLPHVAYEPFAFTRSGRTWEASVKPIYYGLLLFAQAAPAGSRLLPTSHPSDKLLRSWATRGPKGTVRVVLINDSAARGLTLAVRSPGSASSATLERLTAPGLLAKSGIALGGQSFGQLTSTGTLSGRRVSISLAPIQNRYVVRLPPASAALLTLRR